MKKKNTSREKIMPSSQARKFSDDQILSARKSLQALEKKETKKTRDEVFFALEKDIKDALKKGYSLKEISEKLRESGILLPVAFLKNFQLTEESFEKKAKNKTKKLPEIETNSQEKNEKKVDEKKDKKDGFVVPDTPDNEL